MRGNKDKVLNSPTIRRMPSYLHWLMRMQHVGKKTVSTSELAQYMQIGWMVVRKDIALTGLPGRPRVGYNVDALISAIRTFLGWEKPHTAALIGAGALGSAILGYDDFSLFGLRIVSVFDVDETKIGKKVHDHEVLSLSVLPDAFRQNPPELAILCVPGNVAQATAELLVQNGVSSIWNFANVTLHVPEHVIVQREVIAGGLAVLSVKIRNSRRKHNSKK